MTAPTDDARDDADVLWLHQRGIDAADDAMAGDFQRIADRLRKALVAPLHLRESLAASLERERGLREEIDELRHIRQSFAERNAELWQRDQAGAAALAALRADAERLKEIVERAMTAHWDMQACFCRMCEDGRRLGCHPMQPYLERPQDAYLSHEAGAKARAAIAKGGAA